MKQLLGINVSWLYLAVPQSGSVASYTEAASLVEMLLNDPNATNIVVVITLVDNSTYTLNV